MKADTVPRPGMEKGYIRLYRKIRDNPLFQEKRKFSRFEAWIDLLLGANGTDKSMIFDGKPLLIRRGSFLTSERKLAEHWGWSKTKTRLLLFYLQNSDHSIELVSDRKKTVITIINYETYNPLLKAKKTTEADEKKTTEKPQKNHRLAPTNKDKIKENLSPEFFSLVDLLIEKMKENDPKATVPKTQNQRKRWANDFRLLVQQDERSTEEIRHLIIWCQQDSFWKGNILSAGKFRERYSQLKMKMEEAQKKAGLQKATSLEEFDRRQEEAKK